MWGMWLPTYAAPNLLALCYTPLYQPRSSMLDAFRQQLSCLRHLQTLKHIRSSCYWIDCAHPWNRQFSATPKSVDIPANILHNLIFSPLYSNFVLFFPSFQRLPYSITLVCLVLILSLCFPSSLKMSEPKLSSFIQAKVTSSQLCLEARGLLLTLVSTSGRSHPILLQPLDLMILTSYWKEPASRGFNALSR